MTRPIFLSYRRTDSAPTTRRLYDAISERFGAESVYLDTASTAWGEEWQTALENAVAGAEVVIVVIGPKWLFTHDEWGRRRIDNPDDWVRREIELALESDKAILPLLVGEMGMPPLEAFPTPLEELATKQAFRVDDEGWDHQVVTVLVQLESRVPRRVPAGDPPDNVDARGRFRAVASRFYAAPVQERIAAAEEIAAMGALLDLDDVIAFARSDVAAERVGAAIALAAHLRTSERPREDKRVHAALRDLLNDSRSRVRYRAAEVLRGFPALVPDYEGDLRWRADNDENHFVRRVAQKALKRGALRTSPS